MLIIFVYLEGKLETKSVDSKEFFITAVVCCAKIRNKIGVSTSIFEVFLYIYIYYNAYI